MISNRKLYRLGVGVALLMTGFLLYLIYNDVNDAETDSVRFRSHLIGYSDPSDVYVRRELANQILPLVDDLSTPRWSHSKSDSDQPNGYNLISFSLKHSMNNLPLMPKLPSYLDDKAKNINDVPSKQNISTRSKINILNNVKNLTPLRVRPPDLGHDRALPNFTASSILLDSNRYHDVGQSQNVKPIKSVGGKNMRTKKGKRYLVYLCDSESWCGGWGDRQRGIASSFHLSKLIGREFRIVMNTPCNLTKFYLPYKMNWVLDPDEIGPSARRIVLNLISRFDFRGKLKEGDFNMRYPHDVVFIKTNQDLIKAVQMNPFYSVSIKGDKDLATRKRRIRTAWKELMQPTEFILSQLQDLLGSQRLLQRRLISKPASNLRNINKTVPKPLICAHVRMGKNPSMPEDQSFDSISPSDIPTLLHFLQSLDKRNNAEFFLATDFEGIRGSFSQFFGDKLLQQTGRIVHIDRQRKSADACLGFGVAVIDQLVLSVCDQLVVSRSGFSIHAHYVSNNTHPAYIIEDGAIRVFVE